VKTILSLVLYLGVICDLYARDLTVHFENSYNSSDQLTPHEVIQLKKYDFYLVPGILSESFIINDRRSVFDFSILTKEYFSVQNKFLKSLGLKTSRLATSSFSVVETRRNIRKVINTSHQSGREIFFITHSLGGLALLDELLNGGGYEKIAGIIFLQSPFYGTPAADVYLSYPYELEKWLKQILPFFNTSEETLKYLSTPIRKSFMTREESKIRLLLEKIPVLTVGGVANGHRSLFKPSVDLIDTGCIKKLNGTCLTEILHPGPYDLSDGMVPLKSSRLSDSDFVTLDGVDHGETVVNIPYETLNKKRTTEILLKLFLRYN
jgi:triacylglycerol lipase